MLVRATLCLGNGVHMYTTVQQSSLVSIGCHMTTKYTPGKIEPSLSLALIIIKLPFSTFAIGTLVKVSLTMKES